MYVSDICMYFFMDYKIYKDILREVNVFFSYFYFIEFISGYVF